jgi:hypothetical protein
MSDNDFPNQPAGNGRAHESREVGSPRPVTGILDIVDNRAFVRTEGYPPGPRDAPVPWNWSANTDCAAATRSPAGPAPRAGTRNSRPSSTSRPSTDSTRATPCPELCSPSWSRSTRTSGCGWRPNHTP